MQVERGQQCRCHLVQGASPQQQVLRQDDPEVLFDGVADTHGHERVETELGERRGDVDLLIGEAHDRCHSLGEALAYRCQGGVAVELAQLVDAVPFSGAFGGTAHEAGEERHELDPGECLNDTVWVKAYDTGVGASRGDDRLEGVEPLVDGDRIKGEACHVRRTAGPGPRSPGDGLAHYPASPSLMHHGVEPGVGRRVRGLAGGTQKGGGGAEHQPPVEVVAGCGLVQTAASVDLGPEHRVQIIWCESVDHAVTQNTRRMGDAAQCMSVAHSGLHETQGDAGFGDVTPHNLHLGAKRPQLPQHSLGFVARPAASVQHQTARPALGETAGHGQAQTPEPTGHDVRTTRTGEWHFCGP